MRGQHRVSRRSFRRRFPSRHPPDSHTQRQRRPTAGRPVVSADRNVPATVLLTHQSVQPNTTSPHLRSALRCISVWSAASLSAPVVAAGFCLWFRAGSGAWGHWPTVGGWPRPLTRLWCRASTCWPDAVAWRCDQHRTRSVVGPSSPAHS